MAEIVSPDVLNNMGDLSGLLAERGYTTATVAMDGETVVRNPYGTESSFPADGTQYVTHGAQPEQQPGVVPPPQAPAQPVQQPQQPQVSLQQYQAAMSYAARMQQAAQEAARLKLEAEDEAWLAGIAHLPQLEQDREILIRHNQRLQEANNHLYETDQQRREREEEEEQLEAKEIVAWTLATQHGLPWGNEGVRTALMSAPDRQTMDAMINGLRALTPAQQAQVAAPQTRAQVAGQQFVAAPARGGGGRQAPAVRPGSGDIAGLLKSRPYQAVSQ